MKMNHHTIVELWPLIPNVGCFVREINNIMPNPSTSKMTTLLSFCQKNCALCAFLLMSMERQQCDKKLHVRFETSDQ